MSCEGLRQQLLSGSPINYVSRSGEQVLSQCQVGESERYTWARVPYTLPAWLSNPNQGVLGWVALFGCDTCLIKLVKVSGILSAKKKK